MLQCARRPRERGETLVELLLTIAILGLAIVALVAGLATGIAASGSHRRHANANAIARSVAEILKNPDPNSGTNPDVYQNCAGNASYPLPSFAPYQVALAVKYWSGSGSSFSDGSFSSACQGSDLGLQQITITVTANGQGERETVTILKRRT